MVKYLIKLVEETKCYPGKVRQNGQNWIKYYVEIFYIILAFFHENGKIDVHLYSTLCIYYKIDVTRGRIHQEKKQYFGIFTLYFFPNLGKLKFVAFIEPVEDDLCEKKK